jgi:hypothetical protein
MPDNIITQFASRNGRTHVTPADVARAVVEHPEQRDQICRDLLAIIGKQEPQGIESPNLCAKLALFQMPAHPMSSTDSASIPDEIKSAMLVLGKGGTWYDGWQPYCLTCSTTHRTHRHPYGFRCGSCGNMIGFDLVRLADSPLNLQPAA